MPTTHELIKSYVSRVENINEQIKSFNDDKRDIFAEAKSNGLDVKALKIVIQRRAKDPDELSELQAIVETYESALGTNDALARARATPSLDDLANRSKSRLDESMRDSAVMSQKMAEAGLISQEAAEETREIAARVSQKLGHGEFDGDLDIPDFLDRRQTAEA